MSWISTLSKTYDNCVDRVGEIQNNNIKKMLLPISHTTKLAELEITIDESANLVGAYVLMDKKERMTVLPCTIESAARAGPEPHPLFDNIKYLAGDYIAYGGNKKYTDCYNDYMMKLEAWCASEYTHPKVCAVFNYLKRGSLIKDLIDMKILFQNDDGTLLEKWTRDVKKKPPIFNYKPFDIFIRFRVEFEGDSETKLWFDKTVWNSFISYYRTILKDMDICYVSGKMTQVTDKHPKYIRNGGDGAKLISIKEDNFIKYSGYFKNGHEAISVGYETSVKAHNMLKWLIARQHCFIGNIKDPLTYIAWGTRGEDIPRMTDDNYDLNQSSENKKNQAEDDDDIPISRNLNKNTNNTVREDYAGRLRSVIQGYKSHWRIGDDTDIVVLGLDSATPGRLSIVYYREMKGSDLFQKLAEWNTSCMWEQQKFVYQNGSDTETIDETEDLLDEDEAGETEDSTQYHDEPQKAEKEKPKGKLVTYIGAPSPMSITTAAYGINVDDKYKKAVIKRLVPCIYDGADIPFDIVRTTVNRLSNRAALDENEFNQILGVACALIKKYHYDKYKEEWNLKLDNDCNNRSYLFGRLLAYAENAEKRAMYVSGEQARQTNAERQQHQFTIKPAKTYSLLWDKLESYFKRMGPDEAEFIRREMNELYSRINIKDVLEDKKLDDVYLLGYACQMTEFQNKIKAHKDAKINKEKKDEHTSKQD